MSESLRVKRKVKIDGKWILAPVPMVKGKPDAKHVLHKGKLTPVDGGTFYLDHGYGRDRKRITCGTDPESVRRALRTQAHVIELRAQGMDVDDAPEIGSSKNGVTLRSVAKEFAAEPPGAYRKKTISKHNNAHSVFADFAASVGIFNTGEVTKTTITRWITEQKRTLDGSTIVPKVRIVLAELKRRGNVISLEERDWPKITTRERDIYTEKQLEDIFRACDRSEFELYQVFLQTGLRLQEVAYLEWSDIDPIRSTVRVSRKRHLGFVPKTYEERTVPAPRWLVEELQVRGDRTAADGVGLIFGTSQSFYKRGDKGGKADKKMLDKLKQIARRAGLNCGQCHGYYKRKPVTCATHPVCKVWGIHKFRHTYATAALRDHVDIVTLSKRLGHKDIATTRIYLKALEAEMDQPQVENSSLAKAFAGKAPIRSKVAKRHSQVRG